MPIKYSKKQVKALITAIYEGRVTTGKLPEGLYYAIADNLKEALYDGYGGTLLDFGGKPLEVLEELRENIYIFSAAKTYQEVRAVTMLLSNNNDISTFKQFYDEASKVLDVYNKNYLRTEYNTAIASAQQASYWNKIEEQADTFPLLEMTVVEDANTSEICRPLDGIVLPINHAFWRKYYPPNHFNCRSTVLQRSEGRISSDKQVKHAVKHAEADVLPIFQMNVGIDRIVFSKEHPYFDVEKGDRDLAKKNFNLPIPKKD